MLDIFTDMVWIASLENVVQCFESASIIVLFADCCRAIFNPNMRTAQETLEGILGWLGSGMTS